MSGKERRDRSGVAGMAIESIGGGDRRLTRGRGREASGERCSIAPECYYEWADIVCTIDLRSGLMEAVMADCISIFASLYD